jgi:hypothetical protein
MTSKPVLSILMYHSASHESVQKLELVRPEAFTQTQFSTVKMAAKT